MDETEGVNCHKAFKLENLQPFIAHIVLKISYMANSYYPRGLILGECDLKGPFAFFLVIMQDIFKLLGSYQSSSNTL